MTHRIFEVPETSAYEEFGAVLIDTTGPGVQRFEMHSADGLVVHLVVDVPGRSVAVQVDHGTSLRLDLVREGAVGLNLDMDHQQARFAFRTDDTVGELVLELAPELRITETSLLT